MKTELSPVEARILGCLIEKSYLTPEVYPLSFQALLAACNQKTSRDPVMALDLGALGAGFASLAEKGLAAQRAGSRVPKYVHHAEVLGAGDTPEALATLAVLLLRGAQTAAEVRARTERMCQFPDNAAAEALLERLASRPEGPLVARLSRGRYKELLTGPAPAPSDRALSRGSAASEAMEAARLDRLEGRLADVEARLKALEDRLSAR